MLRVPKGAHPSHRSSSIRVIVADSYGPSYVDPIESLPLLGQILDCPAAAQMQMAMGHRDTGSLVGGYGDAELS
jgi:hypothetical protein